MNSNNVFFAKKKENAIKVPIALASTKRTWRLVPMRKPTHKYSVKEIEGIKIDSTVQLNAKRKNGFQICHRTRENRMDTILPHLHYMWRCSRFQWPKKKNTIFSNKFQPALWNSVWNWSVWFTSSTEIYNCDVWPVKYHYFCRWSKTWSLYKNRSHPTKKRTWAAH